MMRCRPMPQASLPWSIRMTRNWFLNLIPTECRISIPEDIRRFLNYGILKMRFWAGRLRWELPTCLFRPMLQRPAILHAIA